MIDESYFTLIGVTVSVIAGFATMGGAIAHLKRRSPIEGMLLGLFLGPIGLLIGLRAPYARRPMVDEKALNSLQSMLGYQEAGREYARRGDKTA